MSRPNTNGQGSTVQARLREACEPIAAAHGCDLEEIEVKQAGARSRVSIYIDRDGGVDLDTVADVSREIAEKLDSPDLAELLSNAYTLDVGSRGVDKPLLVPRHWRRADGRLVRLELHDGSSVMGRLDVEGLEDATVTITVERDPRYHSTKPPKALEIKLASVKSALIEVDFRAVPPDDAVLEGEEDLEADDSEDSLEDVDLDEVDEMTDEGAQR